ncbi:uncharacterized protein LAESUDRAFT_753531 [Laetiporus sulphureus 93-53]|uniref:Retrotransposon gag domain-containing protein n=1 Tax=Laetiporus sulphureus 93-53 TaxID=1314785 RepID=A0A165I101_9APHY|nr:uncharacterized protein LAESUDRAFT_753531 [Laetiporus sulphureus 93-53]KZT12451.1 hypothetical protein LAESUDRAFT_753531 [Laetiporus sulphureus 93-53]
MVPVTANTVRTTRSLVKNVDKAERFIPHKDTVGVENEHDKLRKCGTCGKLRNEGGSCTDIWHTHYYDIKGQCWHKKDAQPAAQVVSVEETEAIRAFKAAVAANPALLNQQDSELPTASKCKATPRIDLDAHYKHQETNKKCGRLLTLVSLGASSTDRQRAAARVVDTTHIIKRRIIRKPHDHTPLLEHYKPRKGRLITGSHKPALPPELITSNAVPPIIVAPQPVRPLPNFVKVNTHARPIRPLPSKVRPTLHIETLKKQVSATRFRLQPILGAFWERIDQDKRKKVQLLALELDKVCADLYTGTHEYTFVDKQVINTCCLEIGRINFKEIGKQQRLDKIFNYIYITMEGADRAYASTFRQRMDDILHTNVESAHDGSTPRASQRNSPEPALGPQDSASQVGGPASPTPSLLPAYVPPIWEFDGHQFKHLEDALRQSASGEVPDHIREWVIVAMKLTVSTEVAKIYNVLRNKMYEHKKAFESLIQNNKSEHRLKEGMLQTEIGKLKDRILAQDAHMTVLNDKLTGTQATMLDTGKEMMEIKAANVKLRHELASLKASGVTMMQGQTSGMVQSHKPRIKIAEPLHYSGKGSLEDWLQQLGIWMRWNEINDDEHKITMALLHLEGGTFTYMSEYATRAAAQQALGTWEDFVNILKVNYRTLDPDKDVQQHLKDICSKTYPTMVSFAEQFRQWVTKTNLGHTALIGYIAEHRSKDRCPDPKYKGKFEMPKWGQAARAISSNAASDISDDSKARYEAVCAFIASYDVKGKEKEAESEPAVEAARITEVEDNEDFLRRVL